MSRSGTENRIQIVADPEEICQEFSFAVGHLYLLGRALLDLPRFVLDVVEDIPGKRLITGKRSGTHPRPRLQAGPRKKTGSVPRPRLKT